MRSGTSTSVLLLDERQTLLQTYPSSPQSPAEFKSAATQPLSNEILEATSPPSPRTAQKSPRKGVLPSYAQGRRQLL